MSASNARKVVLSILAAGGLLLLGFVVIEIATLIREDPERVEVPPVPIAAGGMVLHRGDVVEQIRGFGLAEPLERADISAQVAGTIVELPTANRVGARVEQGALLARIDSTQHEAEARRRAALVEEAREALVSARAQREQNITKHEIARRDIEIAERELARQESLLSEGFVSEAAVDQARERLQSVQQRLSDIERENAVLASGVTRAERTVEAREAELRQAEKNLGDTEVRAPFTGHIDARFVSAGDYAAPGQSLFRLVDLSALELPIEIPASRAMALAEGAPARVATDEVPPRRAEGTVERVSPTIAPGSRTRSAYVVIRPEGGDIPFPPGTFLSAFVNGRTFADVVAIPRAAIIDGAIYLEEDGHARELHPEFFVMLDDLALTRDDIPEGSVLVTSGFERLYDGAPVTITVLRDRDEESEEELPAPELPATADETPPGTTATGGAS